MMQIDYKCVTMPAWRMAVTVAVRFRPFPPFVLMLVVGVMSVQVLVLSCGMAMVELPEVGCRPKSCRGQRRAECDSGQHRKGHGEPQPRPEPSGERIGNKPGGMGKRKLRRVEGWPIALPARPQ